ncbi:ketoacyl-ACP synthase III [Thalassotalea litorea]|uniref:Beta-ketoacyl-[acyl-carrier-protein] synthase III n=1 Tax=Thalassotalea litorea TaxID=2020715 RepID=A0A5R9IUL7_9GAMM|nr:ketoacyl-ACP synthase III [Thalassotalea litorea]TLU66866.1 ketoacyl-ACP synthase III [Thalassotalea litorea]
MQYAEITGWGKYTPPAILTNDDLATFLETSDEWISSRTGIKERRISHINTAEMSALAAKHALASAGIEADDLDLIIIATSCPDTLVPNTASRVQQLLGSNNAACFDLSSACTGFLYALQNATAQIRFGAAKKALVIGAERMSWFLNWNKRDTAVLFGDGAGAVILEATDQPYGLLNAKLGCDSNARDILSINNFGTDMDRYINPPSELDISFQGQDIFKRAVRGMGKATETVMEEAGLSVEDVDLLVPHQANIRIIETLQSKLKLRDDQVMVNIQNYGNTSAATVPIALCEALEQGKVKAGDKIMSAAFGAGLTWGAAYIKWGNKVTPTHDYVQQEQGAQNAKELLSVSIEHCLGKQE